MGAQGKAMDQDRDGDALNGAGAVGYALPRLVPLFWFGAAVLLAVVLLVAAAVIQGRIDAQRAAQVTTANLSRALADNFVELITRVDLAEQSIVDEITRQRASGTVLDAEALRSLVIRHDRRNPDIYGFRIFGPDGLLRVAASNVNNPLADNSRQDDFIHLRDHADAGLIVTGPVVGATTQKWAVRVGRRISNPDGSFDGVVYAGIPVTALAAGYSRLDLGQGGVVALYHTSFRLAARYPEIHGPGNPVGTATISDRLKGIITAGLDVAQYDYDSVIDGVRRTANVRRIPGQPYYILVGMSADHYLAEWRRSTVRFVAFGAVVALGMISGMYFLRRWIGEWQRATTILAQRTEQLTQSNADLEQFAYVASHDLQTPLRNVVSYAQLLSRRYKGRLDQDADDFISFIVDSSRQMSQLINDLLEYSRIAGQGKPLGPVLAGEAVGRALANLQADIEACGTTVEVDALPMVEAEITHLTSLFQNLIGNALKYRHPDRKLRLSIKVQPAPGRRWHFTVADNGVGIEAQYFEKVFEMFQRLRAVGDAEGTGIGLTLCRRIVHRFGGAIWLESTPGSGTKVHFTLSQPSNGA